MEIFEISSERVEQYLALEIEALMAELGKSMRHLTSVESTNKALENLYHWVFPTAPDHRRERYIEKAQQYLQDIQERCSEELCAHNDSISPLDTTNAIREIGKVLLRADPLLLSRAPRFVVATIIFKIGIKDFCKCDAVKPKVHEYPF
jgi:hypothetical protein